MPGHDSNRGRKRAREARAALGLDRDAPLPCLLTVVEEAARMPVVVTAELPDDVAGACFREGDRAVLWVNGTQAVVRQRFTLAHELGHAWCRHDGRLEVDTFATLGGRTTNPLEVQANAFAAEFLVPRTGVARVVTEEPTLDHVVVIAAHYGVSAIVVAYRIGELGLASPDRLARLEREIGERLHEDAAARLDPPRLDDRLARLPGLPYLSPGLRGSLLDAGRRGDAAIGARVAGAIDRLL